MEKQAYDYYLESSDQSSFVTVKAAEWTISEEDLMWILTKQCRERRASEYPAQTDYLDAVVKNDETQLKAYIDACQTIKTKYPKP
jgi:hypothetical protein